MRALFLVALLTSPALADCPAAGDLAGGISITYSDDWRTLTRLTDRGTTLEITRTDGADDFFIESEKGIHILVEGSWKDGAPVESDVTRYKSLDAAPLPEVTAGMRWAGRFQVITASGTTSTARQVINAGDESTLSIGDCTYRSIPLHLVYDAEGEPGRSTALSFLPDLGIVILTAAGEVGKEYTEFFRAIAISRIAPAEGGSTK